MTRRAAAAAARELLAQEVQDRAELVAALYDARLAVQAAEAAAATAQEQVRERRRSYAAARQAALAGGWTSDQLDNLGWTAEHTTRRPPRQRPAPRSSSPGDAHPAAAATAGRFATTPEVVRAFADRLGPAVVGTAQSCQQVHALAGRAGSSGKEQRLPPPCTGAHIRSVYQDRLLGCSYSLLGNVQHVVVGVWTVPPTGGAIVVDIVRPEKYERSISRRGASRSAA